MTHFTDLENIPGDELEDVAGNVPHPEEDGRNKEWEDRARVNLEQTPAGVHTNVERDFEPERMEEDAKSKKDVPPAY